MTLLASSTLAVGVKVAIQVIPPSLLVGALSDFLVPQFGNEALRWALAATTGSCFFLGMLAFAWTVKPYAAERLVPALPPAAAH